MKLSQKLVLVFVVVSLVVGIFILKMPGKRISGFVLEPLNREGNNDKDVLVGYGWSTKNNSKGAIDEAIFSARRQLGGVNPDYVILFSTVGYNFNETISEIKNQFGENVKIYGGTSMIGVLTKDGFHIGKSGSLALLAVSSPKITFGVGGADLNKLSPQEAGKEAISSAIENAGMKGKLPKIILMTAAPGKEEEILQGIEEVVGKNVPVIGGSSGDNDLSGKWKQFSNGKVYSNGVTLTAIYTDLKIGWAYEAGYEKSENVGVITKADGRIIYEIDNKPAAEVYNNWTNGIIEDKLKTGGSVLLETVNYPLAKVLNGKHKESRYLSIHPLSVNLPEKSLTVFANVNEGDKILLMHGGWELLLNRAQTTPAKALSSENISSKDVYFGIYTYCAGTLLAIPEEERDSLPLLVNNVLGNKPFVGTFTFGEQGFIEGVGNEHGNLVNSMVVVARS